MHNPAIPTERVQLLAAGADEDRGDVIALAESLSALLLDGMVRQVSAAELGPVWSPCAIEDKAWNESPQQCGASFGESEAGSWDSALLGLMSLSPSLSVFLSFIYLSASDSAYAFA